tara:strand:+ start:624 stop:989 length:366 start_codon:yes stop_codon:yes gene_type:complete
LINNQADWMNVVNHTPLKGFSKEIIEQSVFKQQVDQEIFVSVNKQYKPLLIDSQMDNIQDVFKKIGFSGLKIEFTDSHEGKSVREEKQAIVMKKKDEEKKYIQQHKKFLKIKEALQVELLD